MNRKGHVVWAAFMVINSSIAAIILREFCSIMVGCCFNRVIFIMDSLWLALFMEEERITPHPKMALL